jgi:hypothetical protein
MIQMMMADEYGIDVTDRTADARKLIDRAVSGIDKDPPIVDLQQICGL